MFDNNMYYLVSNFKFNNVPTTIKLPTELTTPEDLEIAMRTALFNYYHLTFDAVRINSNCNGSIKLAYNDQPCDHELGDMVGNDIPHTDYALKYFLPDNMIVVVSYDCIKYFEPTEHYKTDQDIIDQEIFEYLEYYLPIHIMLDPIPNGFKLIDGGAN